MHHVIIGIELGDRQRHICVLDVDDEVLEGGWLCLPRCCRGQPGPDTSATKMPGSDRRVLPRG